MNQFDQLLRAAVQRRAASIDGPRFTAGDVVRRGRRHVRWRRAGTTAAAGVVVALVIALVASVAGQRHAGSPAGPGTPAPLPVGQAGLAVRLGTTIQTPDGRRTGLDVPSGVQLATRAVGGWVVFNGDSELWFAADGAAARPVSPRIGRGAYDWVVSADGAVLAVMYYGELSSYELPTLRPLRTTDAFAVARDYSLHFAGIVGDQAVIQLLPARDVSPAALVWNVRTGSQRRSAGGGVQPWAVARDGSVLRVTTGEGPDARPSCVDIVPLAEVLAPRATGVCGGPATRLSWGEISPGGAWATVQEADPYGRHTDTWIVRADDLRAGVWRPTAIGLPYVTVWGWTGDTTFVATRGGDAADIPHLCRVDGGCVELTMPADLPGAVPLLRDDGLFPVPGR